MFISIDLRGRPSCVPRRFAAARPSRVRSAMQAMLAAVRRGELDVIITYSFSRLFRSMRHGTTLIEDLDARGVRVLTVREGIDTGNESPFGTFARHMIAATAQLERDLSCGRLSWAPLPTSSNVFAWRHPRGRSSGRQASSCIREF